MTWTEIAERMAKTAGRMQIAQTTVEVHQVQFSHWQSPVNVSVNRAASYHVPEDPGNSSSTTGESHR